MGEREIAEEYQQAERAAVEQAERYVEARAAGRLTRETVEAMDAAERELRRAKRRLERAQRKRR